MGWLVLVALVLLVLIGVVRSRRRAERQRVLQRLCAESGVVFSVLDPFPDAVFLPFRMFGAADRRIVENVVWDRADESVRVFDLQYEQRIDDETAVRQRVTCGLVQLPFGVPDIAVLPRDLSGPAVRPVEGRRVALELDAFNQRFEVWGKDPRAVVALLDQRMMSALMRMPLRVAVYIREDRMLLVAPPLEPADVLLLLEAARVLATRVPPVVASLYPPRPMEGPFEDRWLQGSWSHDPTSADPQNRADLGG